MDYLGVAVHSLIVLVFGVSAIGKLRNRRAFDEFTRTARTLLTAAVPWTPSRTQIRGIAGTVVAAELAIPVLVVVPPLTRYGQGLVLLLLTFFSVGIAAAMRRGVRTSCRCFGASSTPLGPGHLIRNAVLFGVAAAGAAAGPRGLDHAEPAGLVVAVAAAATLTLLVVRLDDVIALFTSPSAVAGPPAR